MSAVLVAAALVVATGSVAALASADARLGLVGLVAALVGATLVVDPLPAPAILGVRLAAALLAVALLRGAAPAAAARPRGSGPEPESHLGWPAEALLGTAGLIGGLAVALGLASFAPVTGAEPEPLGRLLTDGGLAAGAFAMALAGGIVAMALPALLTGRGLRRATAAVLATEGAILLRAGLGAAPGPLEEIALGVLLVVVAAGGALIAGAGRAVAEAGVRAS